jgi:hypothetical protein
MTLPAKKQAMVDKKADWEGEGSEGGGHVKRDRAVTDLLISTSLMILGEPAHLSSNCINERVKRKAVIGPHTSGTTYHLVRVND